MKEAMRIAQRTDKWRNKEAYRVSMVRQMRSIKEASHSGRYIDGYRRGTHRGTQNGFAARRESQRYRDFARLAAVAAAFILYRHTHHLPPLRVSPAIATIACHRDIRRRHAAFAANSQHGSRRPRKAMQRQAEACSVENRRQAVWQEMRW